MIERMIELYGIVEGMGTRPALYRFSVSRGLKGYAANRADHVEMVWQGEPEPISQAQKDLPAILPGNCRFSVRERKPETVYSDFSIQHAPKSVYAVNLAAPPDRVPCEKCLKEIMDPADRRYGYAFNACGICGPRTTVMEELPYDRENTSWSDFPLCPDCRKEYESPSDRRFHIQGISCPACGPHLQLFDAAKQEIRTDDPIAFAAEAVSQGKIVALKGVGGFQLICSIESAGKLRRRKHRPDKPFALMAASLAVVRDIFQVSKEEEELLTSPAGPAVLLNWRTPARMEVAPDSPDSAAVMLPSSPLHKLLLMKMQSRGLVIATSGNASGLPPAQDTESAQNELTPLADLILTHDRAIMRRNDDSVCAVTAGRKHIWRRARGYGSVFHWRTHRHLLAVGAGMKNTFALSGANRIFVSTHFGELDDVRSYRAWCRAVRQAVTGFPPRPEKIICDLHPDYPSSRFAAEYAAELGIPLKKAPHHAAHALSAMLDTDLQKAFVFVFDGTGLGPDGVLRGAELFDMSIFGESRRVACWKTVPLPGGDNAVIHPYLQLAARRLAAGADVKPDRHVPEEQLELLKKQCETHWNAPETGSAGRLFDSVSALCGLAPDTITYDGQPAVRLETAARNETFVPVKVDPIYTENNGLLTVDWSGLFRSRSPKVTPRGFHEAVADSIVRMADFAQSFPHASGKEILLTGGVFQNRLLTELVIRQQEKKRLSVRMTQNLPPGDGGISCGQLVWGELNMDMTGPETFAKGEPD